MEPTDSQRAEAQCRQSSGLTLILRWQPALPGRPGCQQVMALVGTFLKAVTRSSELSCTEMFTTVWFTVAERKRSTTCSHEMAETRMPSASRLVTWDTN